MALNSLSSIILLFPPFSFQTFPEHLFALVYAPFYYRQRYAKKFRDVPKGHFTPVSEMEDNLILLRKSIQFIPDFAARLLPLHYARGIFRMIYIKCLALLKDERIKYRIRDRPILPLLMAYRAVACDGAQPRWKTLGVSEAGQCLKSQQECILNHVLGGFP
jgi:hypothetical protein